MAVKWEVVFHEEFHKEFKALDEGLQDELLAHAILVRDFGPNLGRPTVDTLKGSTHANMKELRFAWEREIWRVAFAFDPEALRRSDGGRTRLGRPVSEPSPCND